MLTSPESADCYNDCFMMMIISLLFVARLGTIGLSSQDEQLYEIFIQSDITHCSLIMRTALQQLMQGL